jgi:Flp pilus assembly protein TadD
LTASVASFLTQAQKKGAELPPALSGALLLAAVRLSDTQRQAVRPYQLLVDDDGALELLAGDAPATDGYAAPELRNGAVLSDEARVLVFAAGALGYELVTLTSPRPGEEGAGPEVRGPLAPVIRKALAERQHRYKTLRDMARAIEAIQGRPTRDEERLILAAIAASTQLPASQKLAKMELQKAAAPEAAPQGPPAKPAQSIPAFTQVWDPLENQPPAKPPDPPPAHPPPAAPKAEPSPAAAEVEERTRQLAAALESRSRELADLGSRLLTLEEHVRSSLPPPLSGAAALARDVKQLLDRRSFGEAERALQGPMVENDPTLQLLLGQALSSAANADPKQLDRAAAAFRRASALDAAWARPRALLGALLWRQGKRPEAKAELRAAVKLDPACPEALAALSTARPGTPVLALSGAAGALATALLVFALRPTAPAVVPSGPRLAASSPSETPNPQPPAPTQQATSPQPQAAHAKPAPASAPEPQAADAKPAPASAPEPQAAHAAPAPEPEARHPAPVAEPVALRLPDPEPAPKVRSEPKPRAKKSANRAAAESESAKGDQALRAFDTKAAQAAFSSALQLDPALPSAHRGLGMVYVLLGKNAEAKAEYTRYLELAPDASDKERIARVLAR